MLIFKRIYKKKKRKKRKTKAEKEEALLRRQWGMKVRALHDHTCCITGVKNPKKVVAHHLNSYHTHPTERFSLDNGVVLLSILHKKFHKTYGYKDTTKEQFLEFYTKEKKLWQEKSKKIPRNPSK